MHSDGSAWGPGPKGEESSFAFIFLLTSFIYNTSADVKTVCLLLVARCDPSSLQCFPKCDLLGPKAFFEDLIFKADTHTHTHTHTHISSSFENKGYHIFPRQIDERREDADMECEFISNARSHKDDSHNVLPNCSVGERCGVGKGRLRGEQS